MMINITKLLLLLILFSGLITLNIVVNLDEISYKTTEMIRPYILELDNHDIHFKHNFCESRIYPYSQIGLLNEYEVKLPETINMYSSFFIFFYQ